MKQTDLGSKSLFQRIVSAVVSECLATVLIRTKSAVYGQLRVTVECCYHVSVSDVDATCLTSQQIIGAAPGLNSRGWSSKYEASLKPCMNMMKH